MPKNKYFFVPALFIDASLIIAGGWSTIVAAARDRVITAHFFHEYYPCTIIKFSIKRINIMEINRTLYC